MTWSADQLCPFISPRFRDVFCSSACRPPHEFIPPSPNHSPKSFVPSSKTFLNLYLKGYPRHPSSPYFRTSKMARTGFVAVACAALAASASALTVVTPSADLNVVADR